MQKSYTFKQEKMFDRFIVGSFLRISKVCGAQFRAFLLHLSPAPAGLFFGQDCVRK